MQNFAFCEASANVIRVENFGNSDSLPFFIYNSQSNNVASLAFTSSGELILCSGVCSTVHNEIHKVESKAGPESLLYTHPYYISYVRTRKTGGMYRIYFSVAEDFDSNNKPKSYKIYYLTQDGGVWNAKLYTTIDPKRLTFPSKCDPDGPEWYDYWGDFVFGDNNTLYLSTGNWAGMKVVVYKIEGAEPDVVTSGNTVKRIYLGDGEISCLCYESPGSLFFKRNGVAVMPSVWSGGSIPVTIIYRLDLTSTPPIETEVGKIPLVYVPYYPCDIAEISQATQSSWWFVASGLAKWLSLCARIVINTGEMLSKLGPTNPEPGGW
jgi:hypothetical protein